MTERRWKVVKIDNSLMPWLLKPLRMENGRMEACHCTNLPDDALVVDVGSHDEYGTSCFWIKLESKEFPVVGPYESLPELVLEYSRTLVKEITNDEWREESTMLPPYPARRRKEFDHQPLGVIPAGSKAAKELEAIRGGDIVTLNRDDGFDYQFDTPITREAKP